MFRPSLEQLEQREVYSVSPVIAAVHGANPLGLVSHGAVSKSQDIVVENDEAHLTRIAAVRTETVDMNETITINGNVGDTLTHEFLHDRAENIVAPHRQSVQGLIYSGESGGMNEAVVAAHGQRVQEESKFKSSTTLAGSTHDGIIAVLIGL